jgi:hypothetical protein
VGRARGLAIATARLDFSFVFRVLEVMAARPFGKNTAFWDHFTQNRREKPVIA